MAGSGREAERLIGTSIDGEFVRISNRDSGYPLRVGTFSSNGIVDPDSTHRTDWLPTVTAATSEH